MSNAGGGGSAAAVTTYVRPQETALSSDLLREVDPTPRFRIGEVSERLGLSLRSIRYYEEAGLVTPAGRTSGGFRMYSEFDVQRLLGVMQMKPLGFSLDRMREVLADLDLLRDDVTSEAERAGARERLAVLHDDMTAALADLASRLEFATMFTRHLEAELHVASEPDGDRPGSGA